MSEHRLSLAVSPGPTPGVDWRRVVREHLAARGVRHSFTEPEGHGASWALTLSGDPARVHIVVDELRALGLVVDALEER